MQGTPLDTMKSKINKGITTVSLKTSSSMEKAKISTYIESVKNEINHMKLELGNKVYELWRIDGLDKEKLEADIERIQNKEGVLDDLRQQLLEIDSKANEILGRTAKTDMQAGTSCICPNCGKRYAQKVNFCIQCGNQITQ